MKVNVLAAVMMSCVWAGACGKQVATYGESGDPAKAFGDAEKVSRTVVPGTFEWDLDTDTIAPETGEDVIWEMDPDGFLTPVGSARLAVLPKGEWDEITYRRAKQLPLSRVSVAHSELEGGSAILVLTSEQRYFVLRCARFFDLHDFSFPGADGVDPEWREWVRTQPDRSGFHVEFEWKSVLPPGD